MGPGAGAEAGGSGGAGAGTGVGGAVSLIDLDHSEPPPPQPPVSSLVGTGQMSAAPEPEPEQPPLPLQQQAAAGGAGGVVGIAEAQIPSMKKWFNDLVRDQQGTLFENEYVQVMVKHAYQAHQAKVLVAVKNKGGGPFSDVSVTIPEVPFLSVTVNQPMMAVLEGGQTGQLVLAAESMQPFEVAPECIVAFSNGGTQHKYPLRLPVVATKFMDPVPLNGPDFMARWNQLTNTDPNQPREQQVIWKRASGAPIDSAVMADIKTRILAAGLKLGPTSGLDTTDMQVGLPFRITFGVRGGGAPVGECSGASASVCV